MGEVQKVHFSGSRTPIDPGYGPAHIKTVKLCDF